jgi:hypothetical protein
VRNPFDPVRVEDFRLDEPHPLDPEVLGDPYRTGDVDDVLRIYQNQDGWAVQSSSFSEER